MAYTVRFERDESGWWIAEVEEVQGCRTQARSLGEARRRIRDALGLYVKDAGDAELVDDIRLPTEARRAMERMAATRRRATSAGARAAASAAATVHILTNKLGISVRDAAAVLGLSHQRVQQLKQ